MSLHSSQPLRSFAAATLLLAVAGLGGCAGSGSDSAPSTPASKVQGADTKCSDYLKMGKEDRIKVIKQTSKELDHEDVARNEAFQAIEGIKEICQMDEHKDGTMRDIANS